MPYLIDGHNLIPKIPGLQLDHLDDELTLFTILDAYFKKIRKKGVVFFDRASLSAPTIHNTAFLKAHFVHSPSTADEAILFKIKELKNEARNYTVITSDLWISDNARAAGAKVISSVKFAYIITSDPKTTSQSTKNTNHDEIDFWMNEFNNRS